VRGRLRDLLLPEKAVGMIRSKLSTETHEQRALSKL